MLPRPLRKFLAAGLAFGPWSSRRLGPPKRGVRGIEPAMGAKLIEPGSPPPPVPGPDPFVAPALLAELHRSCSWPIPPLHVGRFCNARYFQPTFAVIDDRDRLLHAFSQGWEENARGNNYAFEQVRLRRPLRLPGRTLLLDVKTHSDNYFHWLIEAVPRFHFAELAGWPTAGFDHVLVSNPKKAFHTETLARFGIAPERVVNAAEHPHVECEELIAATEPAMFAYDVAIEAVRKAFPVPGAASQLPRRLFVTRADALHRRVMNEEALFRRLEPLGFVKVSLTGKRVAEQAQIFHAADIIVSAHGAAMANLIFCAPGSTIVELHYPRYTLGLYWRMAQRLGLRYAAIQGTELPAEAGKDPRLADMTIDVEACGRLVDRVINSLPRPP